MWDLRGLNVPNIMQVFQLPKALAYPLFYKLVAPNNSTVTRDAILSWFNDKNVVQVRTMLCFSWIALLFSLATTPLLNQEAAS